MMHRKKFSDIKSLINLALVRLNSVRKKANDELTHKKRILAKHLQDGEFALARLEAERLVKLDWKIESLNLIEIKCEEVRDNVPLLQAEKEVPYDLDEAVSTIIYSRDRSNIPELKDVVRVLERKYGKEYVDMQKNNSARRVDERLIHRLSGQRPNAFLVYSYMKEIAVNYGVEWMEDEVTKAMGERFDVPMTAGAPGVGSASGLGSAAYAVTDGRILPKGQKPKGFTPPQKPDFDVKPTPPKQAKATATKVEVAEVVGDDTKSSSNDNDGNDDGNGGSYEAAPPSVPKNTAQVQQKKPAQQKKPPQKKVIQKKPAPKANTPPAAAKPAASPLSDLEERFNKLRNL